MVATHQHSRAHYCSRWCWRCTPLNRSLTAFGLSNFLSTVKKGFLGLALVRADTDTDTDTGGVVVGCLILFVSAAG